jgi:hypothetical protein
MSFDHFPQSRENDKFAKTVWRGPRAIGQTVWDGEAWVPEYYHPDGTTRVGRGFSDFRKAMQWVANREQEAEAKPAAWETR